MQKLYVALEKLLKIKNILIYQKHSFLIFQEIHFIVLSFNGKLKYKTEIDRVCKGNQTHFK